MGMFSGVPQRGSFLGGGVQWGSGFVSGCLWRPLASPGRCQNVQYVCSCISVSVVLQRPGTLEPLGCWVFVGFARVASAVGWIWASSHLIPTATFRLSRDLMLSGGFSRNLNADYLSHRLYVCTSEPSLSLYPHIPDKQGGRCRAIQTGQTSVDLSVRLTYVPTWCKLPFA